MFRMSGSASRVPVSIPKKPRPTPTRANTRRLCTSPSSMRSDLCTQNGKCHMLTSHLAKSEIVGAGMQNLEMH